MGGTIGVKDLIAQLLERGMAMQTFWGFYITVSLGLVVFFGNAKHLKQPKAVAAIVSLMFIAFAWVNLGGMFAISSQRGFLYEVLRSLGDPKTSTLTSLDLKVANGFLDLAEPDSPYKVLIFHIFSDLVVLVTIWFFTLSRPVEEPEVIGSWRAMMRRPPLTQKRLSRTPRRKL
ncbi:hypothetical protein AWB78_08160 [Caballeronia calidae]|uniref:Uncharacterized protein n=1 Tax=Caballeronia calidae TaxID=1777139 RepID=A0A158EIB4_9BURK|nr:hypothetical protein [Caballeronia calidae]SAL06629.1 hypothetical protein AWB78_08160 [Caballeronia calidae]